MITLSCSVLNLSGTYSVTLNILISSEHACTLNSLQCDMGLYHIILAYNYSVVALATSLEFSQIVRSLVQKALKGVTDGGGGMNGGGWFVIAFSE